jgi:hypothetical protein
MLLSSSPRHQNFDPIQALGLMRKLAEAMAQRLGRTSRRLLRLLTSQAASVPKSTSGDFRLAPGRQRWCLDDV